MVARISRSLYAMLFAALLCPLASPTALVAGSARSQNFIVTAPTRALAQEIAEHAERYRRDLAISWLGRELPPWQAPCPIVAQVNPQLGAGGATSFLFETEQRHFARPVGDGLFQAKPAGRPFGWEMTVQGSRERVLDSVLPHEITHTIFATHFGRPLPRWADEGACTTVEHDSEKNKQHRMLYEFLTTKRGIAFNDMFSMTEYPADILPLYSQGFSLARFLIQQGGRRKFVDYIGLGLETNNWTQATEKYYGFESISELQLTWNRWVRDGSPALHRQSAPDTTLLASHTPKQQAPESKVAPTNTITKTTGWTLIPSQRTQPAQDVAADRSLTQSRTSPRTNEVAISSWASRNSHGNVQLASSNASPSTSQSWYLQQKMLAGKKINMRRNAGRSPIRVSDARSHAGVSDNAKISQRSDAAEKPQPGRTTATRVASRPDAASLRHEVLLEWGTPHELDHPNLKTVVR